MDRPISPWISHFYPPPSAFTSTRKDYRHETVKCYFKGRSTREMLTQILFGAYCVIGGSWILKTFGDFRKWKNDTRILQYLQVSSILHRQMALSANQRTPLTFFKFDIRSCCISNLDVIMALVHLNAKEATTVAMRTLSGLKGNEKKDFPNYFKELGQFSNL